MARVSLAAALSCCLTVGCTAESPATGTPGVDSRLLDLTDASRVTDPTPGVPGDEVPGRHLPTTLWYPATHDGPLPVVVFSHGLEGNPASYSQLLSEWAAAGFLVVAPTFPLTSLGSTVVRTDIINQPADVSFVLSQVLALAGATGDPLAGRIDGAHVTAAGHSGGAITTLGLLNTCCADPRITSAIVLSGTLLLVGDSFASPGVPTLFVHGEDDDVLPISQGRGAYAAAPAPKAFLELSDGGHAEPFQDGADSRAPLVRSATTDFLRWTLQADPSALAELRRDVSASGTGRLVDDQLPTN